MKGYCEICDKEIEVQMCCSGYECGCMGQPIEPPICSEKCFIKWNLERERYEQIAKRKERKEKLNKIKKL